MGIDVIASVKTKKGHAADAKPLLIILVNEARKEKTCQGYDVFQSKDDENLFIIHEQWPGEIAQCNHMQEKYVQDFIKDVEPFLTEDIALYRTEKIV